MNQKKKIILFFAIFFPLIFASVFASWVIVNTTQYTPSYNPNSTSALFEAYNNQTKEYNGTYQFPTSTNEDIDDDNISFSYREANTTGKYKSGLPYDVGTYDILLQDETNKYADDVVRFTISQASLTCDVIPEIEEMYEGDPLKITNEEDLIFKGVKGEVITGKLTVSSDVTYPESSTNITETIDVSFTFTPSSEFSKNYTATTITSTVKLNAIAYVKATNNIYFGTIQKALNSSVGTDVYIINGMEIEVSKNIVIPNGKKLLLPYSDEKYYNNASSFLEEAGNTSFIDTNTSNVSTYRNICLYMKNGADIIVQSGGQLLLGGEFKSTGVSRYYSEINLDSGSMIEVNGDFTTYGYIKENSTSFKNTSQSAYSSFYDNSYDSGRGIFVKSTGYLITPIAVYDLKQGSTLSALVNNNICPFNIFNFPNLQTYTEIENGGVFDITVHLIAAGQTVLKNTSVVQKDSSKASLFYLSSGKMAFDYATTNANYTSSSAKTKIYIDGHVEQGYLYIKDYVTIDSRNYYLPISYMFNIIFVENSSYYSNYKLKFMQGSILKIQENATFTINAQFTFYESNSLSEFTSSDGVSYSNKTDAVLINNGTIILESNGSIGARITTENTNGTAKLDFTKASQNALTATSNESTANTNIPTISTTGPFKNHETNEVENLLFKAGEEYYSANSEAIWEGNPLTSYKLIINVASTNYLHNLYNFTIYTSTSADGTENQKTMIENSVLTNYELDCESGTYVRIVVNDAASTIISDTNLTYSADTWYEINKNLTMTINPSQGFKISYSLGGSSGAGSQTFTIKYGTTESNLNKEYKSTSYNGNEIFAQGIYFTISPSSWGKSGYNAKVTQTTYDENNNKTETVLHNGSSQWSSGPYLLDGDYKFEITNWAACITSGSLLTLADGTQKKVEELLDTDLLLVFNHETGQFEAAPLIFVDRDEWTYYDVVNLEFSNGEITRLIYEHGYFNNTLNKYVYITEDNYQEYIGHEFTFYNGNELEKVTLVNSYITNEYVGCYSPVTAYHLNYFVNGFLSMPGGITGLFNIFEYNEDMTYDIDKMNEDIAKYGLYTYEDFKDYLPYEVYLAFPGPYLKVSVGKGYVTFEEILAYIEQYLGRHGLDK